MEMRIVRADGSAVTAVVDDADWPLVSGRRWHAFPIRRTWYAATAQGGRRVYLHRFLLGLSAGDGLEVDHINGNGLDCRRVNMRVVTHAQNLQNQKKQDGRSSKYRGVYYWSLRGVWAAKVKLNGKTYSLGHYRDEDEAGRVVAEWRAKHMPFSVETAPTGQKVLWEAS